MTISSEPTLGVWLLKPFRSDRVLALAFWLLLSAALAIRLFLVAHTDPYNSSDARDYHEFAKSLLAGRGYMQVYDGETGCYRGMTFYAYRMPGYSTLLAAVYGLFGYVPAAAMMLNVIAEMITLFCMAVLGWHFFGRWASIVAQLVWVLHPMHTTDLITESISIAAFVLMATLLAHGGPLRSRREALLYGLVSVYGIFIRPINVVSYLMLGVEMLRHRLPFRRIMLLGLVAFLPTALGLGAWTWRNYRLLGYPVVLTSQGGRVNTKDYGISFERMTYGERAKGNHNEAAISAVLKKKVKEKMEKEPKRVLAIYKQRFLQLLTLSGKNILNPSLDINRPHKDLRALHYNVLYGGRMPKWVINVMCHLYYLYYPVYILAALTPIICWRSRKEWAVLAIPVLCFLFFHAGVTKGNVRYAATIFPHLALLAGGTLACIITWLASRIRRRTTSFSGA